VEPPDRSIVELPELKVYYEDFGKGKDDCCLVAEDDSTEGAGEIAGAVWTRVMDDYGHVDDDTPSLAISLYENHRGKGIGTQLLNDMLCTLKEKGYKRVSLSVQKANYAVRMYQHAGFNIVDENEEEGIWGDVISRLKENAITFALLLIFVGGFFVVTYYRNKKNI